MGKEDKTENPIIEEIFGEKEAKKAKKLGNSRNTNDSSEINGDKKNVASSNKKVGVVKESKETKKTAFEELTKKERREHLMIMVFTVVIILLLAWIGYSMYTFYQAKAESTSKIFFLNGTLNNLTEEKSQLILNNTDLTAKIVALENTIDILNDQKASLLEEVDSLNSDLANSQEEYDDCSSELNNVQDDLEACEATC